MNPASPIKVALVDDHALFREGVRLMLEDAAGLTFAFEAANGREMMEFLEAGRLPEVILLDLEMPEMDGMESCELVKSKFPGIKILILTMHRDAQLIQHMMKMGANGYLLKSARWEEVERAIFQVQQKDFYFSDLVGLSMIQALQNPVETPPASPGPTIRISRREQEVLELIFAGNNTPEIAETLFISQRTVEGHRSNLLKRLEARNMADLIVKGLQHRLISLPEL
ncbi:MAG: response regulator transcription factor [Bacteroidota bacterium]